MIDEGARVVHKKFGCTGTVREIRGIWSPKKGELFWKIHVDWDDPENCPAKSFIHLKSVEEITA